MQYRNELLALMTAAGMLAIGSVAGAGQPVPRPVPAPTLPSAPILPPAEPYVEAMIGDTATLEGISINPRRVIEDSRGPCLPPPGSTAQEMCVAQGQLIVSVRIGSGRHRRTYRLRENERLALRDGALSYVARPVRLSEGERRAGLNPILLHFTWWATRN